MQRRHLLRAGLGSLAGLALVGPSRLVLAQACTATPTETNIEGPFYRSRAPYRSRLVGDMDNASLVISGTVTDSACRPQRGTTIELWQADEHGEYDLEGDRYRGIVRCDANGMFQIETIVPGRYLNGGVYRPAHLHAKVHANGRPVLTTQLYFPGDPQNDSDPWFRPSLLLASGPSPCCYAPSQPHRMTFQFVV
jgi:protocatechuate 3,4-dioxygenase beta subunit